MDKKTLEARVDSLETTVTDLKTTVTQLDAVIRIQGETIVRIEAALDSANTMIRQQGEVMAELRTMVLAQAASIDVMETTNMNLVARVTVLESTLAARNVEAATMTTYADLSQARMKAAEGTADLLGRHARDLRSQMREAGLSVPVWPAAG